VKLRFPTDQVQRYARGYEEGLKPRDRRLTAAITRDVFPAYRARGCLLKEEFLTVCAWKTPRSQSRCASNDASLIEEISRLVLTTHSEALRIQAWTLLAGVKWPTASVFLHFAFENQYPILDYRALWSLGFRKPPRYTFKFWESYTAFCRATAAEASVSMRVLDQALWMYSSMNQE
jgi:hypothetical protein